MSNPEQCRLALLEHEGLLSISGPDSTKFLQGQVTCDVRQLSQHAALPGAYCTPQGRVVCDFLLAQAAADAVLLRMRKDLLQPATAVLGKYIIFSRAEVKPADSSWRLYGCWGPAARKRLAVAFGRLPDAQHGAVVADTGILVQLDPEGQRFELWLRGAPGETLAQTLANECEAAGSGDWIAEDVEAGLGRVEAATGEEFVPQTLNYDLTGHISFSKGCYTGQEVVARLHYRGKPKRRLYALQGLDGTTAAAAGTGLYAAGREQAIGTVVNVARASGRTCALGVVAVALANAPLHLGAPDGPEVSAVAPGYLPSGES